MSDILLRELSNADIDWLVTSGERRTLATETILVMPGETLDSLYLVLEGSLALSAPCSGHEFAQLSRGDLFGIGWLFKTKPVSVTTAKSEVVVLAVAKATITAKLRSDASFAAHFYRAIALILSARIRRQFEAAQALNSSHNSSQADLLRYQSGVYPSAQRVKEALFVFGELRDSDIDWMLSTGQVERLEAGKVLLNMGRPVDALYTVLDGQLSIATTDQPCDPLSTCSHGLEEAATQQTFVPLAHISRGGLPGIISFLDFQPLPVRIHATQNAKLLNISRQRMAIKLQEDLGFAARFYRVIAAQTAQLLLSITATECRQSSASGETENNETMLNDELDGELDIEELQQASEGAAKFDWMLKQLRVDA